MSLVGTVCLTLSHLILLDRRSTLSVTFQQHTLASASNVTWPRVCAIYPTRGHAQGFQPLHTAAGKGGRQRKKTLHFFLVVLFLATCFHFEDSIRSKAPCESIMKIAATVLFAAAAAASSAGGSFGEAAKLGWQQGRRDATVAGEVVPKFTEEWFNQTLDHFRFRGTPRATFPQRYLKNDDHWGTQAYSSTCKGPILFYTGACASCALRVCW